jgi:hypothetical protein
LVRACASEASGESPAGAIGRCMPQPIESSATHANSTRARTCRPGFQLCTPSSMTASCGAVTRPPAVLVRAALGRKRMPDVNLDCSLLEGSAI